MRRLLLTAALFAGAACAGAPPAPPRAAAVSPKRLVPTTRGRILVDDGGQGGLPVLFLHGAGGDHGVWAETLAHVRRSRRAAALDLPGFGRSDPPRGGDYSAQALGEDVGRAADALGMSRFVLVVHGFSGAVGVAYASRHPLRVAGLLFVDATGGRAEQNPAVRDAERQAFAPDRYRETAQLRYGPMLDGATAATRERVLAALEGTSREALLGAALAVLGVDPAASLAKYPGPRFALAVDRRVLEGIQATVERLPYRKVGGASHWMMLDAPGEVNAALDELLAKAK